MLTMKNKILFIVMFFAIGISSCKDKEEERLEIGISEINFNSDANSQTINVFSNISWTAYTEYRGNDEWCTISPSSGNGDGLIQIMVKKNNATSKRGTSITIYGGSQTVSLSILQDGSTDTGGGATLAIPTGLAATKNGSSIRVSWNSVSGATAYNVGWSQDDNNWYYLAKGISSTIYTDSSPEIGYNYYMVQAINGAIKSNWSNTVVCNYTSGGGGGSKPDAPTGVTTINNGSALIPEIYISWNSVSEATSYKVFRSSSATGTYSQIGSATPYTHLSDLNPINGNNYYKVKAVNNIGESNYSSYALYNHSPSTSVAPCPVTYGNCTVNGTTITMRWTVPTSSGCGVPTKAYLRVREPSSEKYVDIQTLSSTTNSASFNYGMWIDSYGYVYVGIITENDKGTSGGLPKVYDTKNKRWIN